MTQHITTFDRRKMRIRTKLRACSGGKPRLTVHRTNCHIYAQLICDINSKTLASASTLEGKEFGKIKVGCNRDSAAKVGELIAQRAVKAGFTDVVFDRSGYQYHGRIKSLADAARENGLKF